MFDECANIAAFGDLSSSSLSSDGRAPSEMHPVDDVPPLPPVIDLADRIEALGALVRSLEHRMHNLAGDRRSLVHANSAVAIKRFSAVDERIERSDIG